MTTTPAAPTSQLALGLDLARQAIRGGGSDALACDDGLSTFEAEGQAIGRAYARAGLMPAPDHLHPGHPVRVGWESARAPGQPRPPSSPHLERWLALRLHAWLRGLHFDRGQVTPGMLARLAVSHCPVTREPLVGGAGAAAEAVVVALNERAGYVSGNLAMVSRRAAQALADPTQAALLEEPAALRLWSLRHLVTPMTHAQACAQPLRLLPPVRVRVLNPAHELQVVLGTLSLGPGYARRMSELGALMPGAGARRAYALFMSTLLARRLEAATGPAAPRESQRLRQALEDAFQHPAVLRRWEALVAELDAAACQRLVRRALSRGLAGTRMRWLADEHALEGWEGPGYSTQS